MFDAFRCVSLYFLLCVRVLVAWRVFRVCGMLWCFVVYCMLCCVVIICGVYMERSGDYVVDEVGQRDDDEVYNVG